MQLIYKFLRTMNDKMTNYNNLVAQGRESTLSDDGDTRRQRPKNGC